MTSKGRFGAEEERGSGGTSTRRRLAPRSLATITVGGHESIMVQSLRQEEQQRAKEEKRLVNTYLRRKTKSYCHRLIVYSG